MNPVKYPQALPMSASEIEDFLTEAPIARLCSHNSDGTIHVAPLIFRYDNGELLFGTQKISRKVRNIQQDRAVSVLVDTQEPPHRAVLIYGQAELDEKDVISKRVMIFEKDRPREAAEALAKNLASQFEPIIIRVRPEKIVSFDYAKGFN
jgi:nitroimidazol reductase NimA-like FMN-containing flavoprotein (pyridoxamine 5'-phosphate oxidase superfamily)